MPQRSHCQFFPSLSPHFFHYNKKNHTFFSLSPHCHLISLPFPSHQVIFPFIFPSFSIITFPSHHISSISHLLSHIPSFPLTSSKISSHFPLIFKQNLFLNLTFLPSYRILIPLYSSPHILPKNDKNFLFSPHKSSTYPSLLSFSSPHFPSLGISQVRVKIINKWYN